MFYRNKQLEIIQEPISNIVVNWLLYCHKMNEILNYLNTDPLTKERIICPGGTWASCGGR